ncbi:NAD(P)/FAD-dependent oxidoreductase [Candidatus Micrarchaeota archaeon]|nr:NAD(P)/FAD-dependent oxidoreductase [Candidatus Micrarchaeota archaeon]
MAIMGAGPAGIITGLNLLKEGHNAVVYDRFGENAWKHAKCSGILSEKALKEFQKIVPLKHIKTQTRLNVWFGNKKVEITPKQHAYVIDRHELDRLLVEKFISSGGKLIHKNITPQDVIHFSKQANPYIIGADGPVSTVAQTFNFPRFTHIFKTGQIFLDMPEDYDDSVNLFLDCKGLFGWSFPKKDKLEVGIATEKNPSKELKKLLKRLNLKYTNSPTYHIIPLGPRKKFAKTDNNTQIFLVGDAAGHVKPTTGGGLFHSLIASNILTHTILNNNTPEYYEDMWRKKQGLNFSTMRLINRTINFIPDSLYPLAGSVFETFKMNKFLAEKGDMEDTRFLNIHNLIDFIL